MKIKSLLYLSLIGLFFYGCVSNKGTVKTYINPALNSSKMLSVAVFPLRNSFVQRNTELSTGDMIDINKMFQSQFVIKNPKTTLVNSVSSTELLNQNNLVNSYDTLLSVYDNTGIPNTKILNKIGTYLKIDALVQGFVKDVVQRDGIYGGNRGETKITIKYVMFSTKTGDILWEAMCEGYKGTATTLAKAPPISDVIEIIKNKIISAMPILSE